MNSAWQPCREPLRVTLLRTGIIALTVGAAISWRWGGLARWPMAALLAFWFTFGGHWVEILFLNGLRPRLSRARVVQAGARVVLWFLGGIALALGMELTAVLLGRMRPGQWPAWWIGGLAFIGVEGVVHLVLQLRGRPSIFNGRG